MLPAIFIILGVIVVFIVIVSTRPAEFKISRSATMAAPAAAVFAEVNDLHRWEGWSPWAKIDPGMKTTYDGARAGAGAISYATRPSLTELDPVSVHALRFGLA